MKGTFAKVIYENLPEKEERSFGDNIIIKILLPIIFGGIISIGFLLLGWGVVEISGFIIKYGFLPIIFLGSLIFVLWIIGTIFMRINIYKDDSNKD